MEPTNKEKKEFVTVHHLIVLDESGSMWDVKAQTISGCNETLGTIRLMQNDNLESQRHFVSVYAFDSDLAHSRYIIENEPIEEVENVTDRDYQPNGTTPLFDAVGFTLTNLRRQVGQKGAIGYVTIITDGYENSSREYHLQSVKAIIDDLKKQNVIFSFIGANIDAAAYGKGLGIGNTLQFSANEEGVREMWQEERQSKLRSSRKMSFCIKGSVSSEAPMTSFVQEENSGSYYQKYHIDAVPDAITSLRPNEVFVFGSNKQGLHNGGAAAYALAHFGAVMGQAEGLQGQAYAIPTFDVTLEETEQAVNRFIAYARQHPQQTFLVTKIGCGHAGLSVSDIAPLFIPATKCSNIRLPQAFIDYINGDSLTD